MPAGTGVKQTLHFGQLVKSGRFQQFDYGRIENYFRYKSVRPPEYDLKKATAKFVVYYAEGDWMTVVEDIKILVEALPNVVKQYIIPHERFNHVDFIFGKDAPKLVYDEIVKTMKSPELF